MLKEYLDSAVEAAREAAKVLEHWQQKFSVREKGRFDLVTEADVASQRAIQAFLSRKFPEHAFLGEEDGGKNVRPAAGAPPTWIIDPIDGTTNYVHGFPFYCISIGLEVAGELVVGVVFEPVRGEMYAAAKGHGAHLNGARLRPSGCASLSQAMLATGFPADPRSNERTLDWWRHLSFQAQALRRTGSTALNLCYLAAGRFDGYWAFDQNVWDVAGAAVVVQEAGGIITNVDGSPFDPYTPDGLASNGPLHPQLLEIFRAGLP